MGRRVCSKRVPSWKASEKAMCEILNYWHRCCRSFHVRRRTILKCRIPGEEKRDCGFRECLVGQVCWQEWICQLSPDSSWLAKLSWNREKKRGEGPEGVGSLETTLRSSWFNCLEDLLVRYWKNLYFSFYTQSPTPSHSSILKITSFSPLLKTPVCSTTSLWLRGTKLSESLVRGHMVPLGGWGGDKTTV